MLNLSRLIWTLGPWALLALSACTLDSVVVLRHPASVAKAETFAVGAVDIVLDVGSPSRPADSIHRDSIHFGIGLPAGWELASPVKVCAAPHFRPARASVNGLDTNLRNRLLLDTLAACESRATALAEDPGVKLYLQGRSLRAQASPDSLGRSFVVKADTVPQWLGFGGRIDVSVPAGQPADTVLLDSALKALPVYVYFSLKAASVDTTVRILYFSKTGRLDTAAFSNASNQDRGALVYRPVTVGSPVSLGGPRPGSGASRAFSIARSGPGSLSIRLPRLPPYGPADPGRTLEIRASSGAVLRSWSGRDLGGGSVSWDGRDATGRPLAAGRYVLVLKGRQGAQSLAFPLLP